jgi:hypothetical protein
MVHALAWSDDHRRLFTSDAIEELVMDVNIRKTATDTAYIVVGVGVLGFQQAQVRRRDALARAATLRRDAKGSFQQRTGQLKARSGGCASNLGDTVGNVGSTVGTTVATVRRTVGNTVSDTVGTVGSQVKAGADAVGSQVKAGADAVGSQVKAGADAVGSQVKAGADIMGTADPRAWMEPVVGDIRVRVEPVVEQLRTITLPGTVSALPDQVSKVMEVGRNRVQGRWGGNPTAAPSARAATGTA